MHNEFITKIEQLPPLDENIQLLGEYINDPRKGAKDIAQVIEKDAALTAQLMKLVNSAALGLRKIESVERAICLVGFSTVCQLAICLQSLHLIGKLSGVSARSLMHHAQQVAHTAKLLAEEVGRPQPAVMYAAGLLHDIGRLALFYVFPERYEKWLKLAPQMTNVLELERQVFGLDHQKAGDLLGEKWRYNMSLREVISRHHQLEASDPLTLEVISFVALADGLVHRCYPQAVPGANRGIPAGVEKILGEKKLDYEKLKDLQEIRSESIIDEV